MNNLIIYGSPGSGKTRCLADIYADLLSDDGTPDNIACVAFNASVADTMDERIASKTGISYKFLRKKKWVATVHGLCRRLLSTEYEIKVLPPREAAKEFLEFGKGICSITITGHEKEILEIIIQLYEFYRAGQRRDDFWLHLFKYLKHYLPRKSKWSINDVRKLYQQIDFEETYEKFYYYRMRQTPITLTFSELISETLKHIEIFKQRFSYILVDEAQDLFPRMWDIIRQMDAKKILVADPYQSIYSFGNVSPNQFLSFPYEKKEMKKTHRFDTKYCKMLENGLSRFFKGREKRDIQGFGSRIRIYNYIPEGIDQGVMLARTNKCLRRYSYSLTSRLVPHTLEEFSFFGNGTRNPLKQKFKNLLVFLESKTSEEFTENIRSEDKEYLTLFNLIKDKPLDKKIRLCLRHQKLKKQAQMLRRIKNPEQFLLDLHEPRIILSTVHKFKGRENKNIIIPDFKAGLFPLRKGNFKEEVRIAYVALSRVKKNLFLEGNSPFRRDFLR